MSENKTPDYVILVQVKDNDEGSSIIAIEFNGTRSEAAYFARGLWQEGLVVPAEKNPTAVKLGLLLDTVVPPAHICNVVVSPYPVSDKAETPEATLTRDEALGILDPDDRG